MAKFFKELDETLQEFISAQKMFFTATAPLNGRINLSPKGMDVFRCLDANTVAYLDLTGSGNETAAHLAVNNRMTIMFCSFAEKPLILRLYGTGEIIHFSDPRWREYSGEFVSIPGQRQLVLMHVQSVQTSCGYAVPLMDFREERLTLAKWAEQKGVDGLRDYRRQKNSSSIDGLPTGLLDEQP